MRFFIVFAVMMIGASVNAQIYSPVSPINYTQHPAFGHSYANDSAYHSKWSLGTYTGFSTSFMFYKGGHASIFSVPLSLQINRELNKNLYAFASVTAAPAYMNFTNTFLNTNTSKFNQTNSFYKTN